MAERFLQQAPMSMDYYGYYDNYEDGSPPSKDIDRSMMENNANALPQDLSMRRVKTLKDKMSHRMIEKRRRDRMNTCLEDLCRLLPANYIKQGQGRIEKTEIIESATRYIQQLQRIQTDKTDEEKEHKICCQKNYETGFNECSRYVTAVLSEAPDDANCLMNYLKSRRVAYERDHNKPEEIRKNGDTCPSPTDDVYKFKKEIRQRFVEDQLDVSLKPQSAVPGFILESSGRYYVPITLNLARPINLCNEKNSVGHPVNIQVKFGESLTLDASD